MSLVMQICKHCGWEMRCGDVLVIKKDNVLTCPSCKRPIEFVEKVAEKPPKDRASEAMKNIWARLPYSATIGELAIDKDIRTIEQELKAKDEQIEHLEESNRISNVKRTDMFHERLGEKDKHIEQLEERNEELEDLVVKWEASYTKLRRKIDDLL